MATEQIGGLLTRAVVLVRDMGELGRFAALVVVDALLRLEATKTLFDLGFARDNYRRRVLARTREAEAQAMKTMMEAVTLANNVQRGRASEPAAPDPPPQSSRDAGARRVEVDAARRELDQALSLLVQHGGALGVDAEELRALVERLSPPGA
jgi:hypothetical protein